MSLVLHATCPICSEERTYEVEVEGPDWDVGAGPTIQGGLVPEESCSCELTEAQLADEWNLIAEKANEPWEPDYY